MNIFSERLRNLLDSRGINQIWLAEKIHTTGATVSRYLNADRMPRGENVASVASALNVSADYLLGLSDDPTPPGYFKQQEIEPDCKLLISCYRKASNSDQRVIWTLLDKYMSPEEKAFLQKLLEYTSESAV